MRELYGVTIFSSRSCVCTSYSTFAADSQSAYKLSVRGTIGGKLECVGVSTTLAEH